MWHMLKCSGCGYIYIYIVSLSALLFFSHGAHYLIRGTGAVELRHRTEDNTVRSLISISQACFGRQEHEQVITWHVAHAA